MRSMLEDLMGADALGDGEQAVCCPTRLAFILVMVAGEGVRSLDDERLCPYYLADVCPYTLFSNTVRSVLL